MTCHAGVKVGAVKALPPQDALAQTIELVVICARINHPDELEVDVTSGRAGRVGLLTQKADQQRIELIELLGSRHNIAFRELLYVVQRAGDVIGKVDGQGGRSRIGIRVRFRPSSAATATRKQDTENPAATVCSHILQARVLVANNVPNPMMKSDK